MSRWLCLFFSTIYTFLSFFNHDEAQKVVEVLVEVKEPEGIEESVEVQALKELK